MQYQQGFISMHQQQNYINGSQMMVNQGGAFPLYSPVQFQQHQQQFQ